MPMSTSRAAGLLRLVPPDPVQGYGHCHAHHGELLQGAFWLDGPHRSATRALVTLPYPDVGTSAVAWLLPGDSSVSVRAATNQGATNQGATNQGATNQGASGERPKAVLAARLALAELRVPGGVRVELTSEVPVGWGLGSSTADVVATVRAVADAAGQELPPAALARLVVAAERASDAVMFGEEVTLFAHREGRVLATLGTALPPLVVVGCNTADGAGVDTLAHPPADYTTAELDQLGHLLGMLRRAVRTGDARLLGAVAGRSAAINQRFLPMPVLGELHKVAESSGAVGVQVAHSGTVAGLLYDGADPRAERLAKRGRAELGRLGVGRTWVFRPHAAAARLVRAVGQ
jgi:uncharacterized protein involved in propanediol utilization